MDKVASTKTGIFSSLEELSSKNEDFDTELENPEPDKTTSTKEKLEQVCALLDEVRLDLTESVGQGFLFNAHHQIQTFLNGLK